MRYVECPEQYSGAGTDTSVFLAGGITSCPDWQAEMVKLLSDTDLTLVSPRRKVWPIDRPEASEEQIVWEHQHFLRVDSILFWFPKETLCPIVLYELGAWLFRPKAVFVGTHPDYQRKQDVIIQSRLERPALKVVHTLEDLAGQVRGWYQARKEKANAQSS
ncbi:MAG: nucleoside 2-deoxyribosyltransferase domain-containing protein, partial [Minisyncoccia bacterium]